MGKRFCLVVLLLLGVFASYAQLPSVTLKDINGKTVDTATLQNVRRIAVNRIHRTEIGANPVIVNLRLLVKSMLIGKMKQV